MFTDPRLTRMAAFLTSIGIPMRAGVVDVPTIFPGSLIDRGGLVIDEAKLIAPGDALHEAAHIALAPPERRTNDYAFLNDADPGEEIATIPWCWAALLHLDIEPEAVFHSTAYPRGDSPSIIENARRGNYIGLPLLQYWGMAGIDPPFPHMRLWLRP